MGKKDEKQPDLTVRGRDGSLYVFQVKESKPDMDFADMLRAAIRESGISQYHLSKAANVPQGAISEFLHGADMRISTFNRLAYYMGLELRVNRAKAPKKTPAKAAGKKRPT